MAILLYGFKMSPFSDKVIRALNVKGLGHDWREVKPSEAGRLKQISPTGKFPVMDYDGRLIVDSTDIVRFLEQRHPEPRLIPADPRAAALAHVFEDWADESLYFYEMTMRLAWANNAARFVPQLVAHERGFSKWLLARLAPSAVARQARAQGVGRKRREVILKEVERHLDALCALLEGRDWLAADHLTIADIAVTAQLACIRGTEEGGPMIAARSAITGFLARVDAATGRRG